MSLEFVWSLLEHINQFLESALKFVETSLDVSEKQPYKLIYDIIIAVIFGIVTGLVVDRLIKNREKRGMSQLRSLMYADVAWFISSLFLIMNVKLFHLNPPFFVRNNELLLRFSDIAWYNCPLEPAKADLFISNSESNLKFKQELAEIMRQWSSDGNKIRNFHEELDEINLRFGRIIEKYGLIVEPEFRTLLTQFRGYLQGLWETTNYITKSEVRIGILPQFPDQLMAVFKAADEIRLKLYSYARHERNENVRRIMDTAVSRPAPDLPRRLGD